MKVIPNPSMVIEMKDDASLIRNKSNIAINYQ